jgi:hypothetical protein
MSLSPLYWRLLAPSSFVRPVLGWHVECAPDRLARL